MATTITNGASASITLTAGQQISTTGTGVATFGPGPMYGKQMGLQGSNAIGPFGSDVAVYLGGTAGLAYIVSAPVGQIMGTIDPTTGAPTIVTQSPSGPVLTTVAGSGVLGPYSDIGALTVANPPASNAGKTAMVGTAPPYAIYACSGAGWYKQAQPFPLGIPRPGMLISDTLLMSSGAPTVTLSAAGAATSITGTSVQTLAMSNAAFTYSPTVGGLAGGGFLQISGGGFPSGNCYVSVMTDSKDFEFVLSIGSTGNSYSVMVNGKYASETPAVSVVTGTCRLRVTFATKRVRKITLCGDILGANTQISGFVCLTTDYVGPPVDETGELWGLMGDSMATGSGGPSDSGGTSLAQVCMAALGIQRWIPLPIPSTGYNTPVGAGRNYVNVVASDIIPLAPTRILIIGCRNDNATGVSLANMTTAAAAVFDSVNAALPNCKIYATTDYSTVGETDNGARGIIAAAATRPWVTVLHCSDYITGTGRVGATTGVGNRDFVIGTDNLHPSAYGHTYIGLRLAQTLMAARALSPT